MTPIYTFENLNEYIAMVKHQKDVLEASNFITPAEVAELAATYDLQISIATKILNRIQNVTQEPTTEVLKMHTLVFRKSVKGFHEFVIKTLKQSANCVHANTLDEFVVENISSHTDLIFINHGVSITEIESVLCSDFIEIPNKFGQVTKRHMIPFIICCSFDKSEVTPELLERCNIIEID